ncbi:hypothetical protein BDQ17DRAFT_435737 [Cyathus striatus]|nr:hypothetical protein BDQ17DRAFT_435737 [Cyathus striatus]
MKRSTNFEDEDSVRKRHKINVDEVFDDPSSAISFPSLLKNNGNGAATVAEKFISGKVNRIWPAGDGMLAFELATSYVSEGHDRTTRLLVCLTESCVQFFDHFDLKPQDNICISLKEAEIRTEDDQSLKLIYSKGVVLRRARKPLDGQPKTINTWKLMEAAAVREDDWFSTPELGIIASAALTPGALIREAGSRSKPVTV